MLPKSNLIALSKPTYILGHMSRMGLQFLWLACGQKWKSGKSDLRVRPEYVETCSSQDGVMHSQVSDMRSQEPPNLPGASF